ncbi:hypothetical protein FLONG3_1056 [Fusarium longipes]|uniref:ACB domain-containing protein n=1 Tax=Fusarium longipes TaxID=694270 RepID=A0A395T7U3_9HYPO|nr:hypothetical protein FLONG3_1056 [Fusarium longipes]
MADSVDRVFVHALNTVKKIPKTGASRPPPTDRLRLYGLYKQAMEGDVDGVMERPTAASGLASDELQREKDKWDAWNLQKGLSRTESKRRYIEALIDTMHRYATTPDAEELVSELEFVWNQIKNNSPSSSLSSPGANKSTGASAHQPYQEPEQASDGEGEGEGPLKELRPMSEYDEAELRSQRQLDLEDDEVDAPDSDRSSGRWQRKVERALTTMSAEVAALREQITTGREWRAKKERSFSAWMKWFAWLLVKHIFADLVILSVVLLWLRRRKDRRLEDLPLDRHGSGSDRLEYPDHIPDPEGHSIIPPLQSFAPAIFRSISEDEILCDLTSTTKLDLLQAELEGLDAHAISTNESFLALCTRERERILQEGRRYEALDKIEGTTTPDVPRGVEPDQLSIMVANMEAKPPADTYMDTSQVPQPSFDGPNRSLREFQANATMAFVLRSAQMAASRNAKLIAHRARIEDEIKKEQSGQERERRVN